MDDFRQAVYGLVARIPEGRIITYGRLAILAGKPRAARLVGQLMSHAVVPDLPYHRVIRADGSLCDGYEFGVVGLQRELLRSEGIPFLPDGRVNVKQCLWLPEEASASLPREFL